MAVPGFWGKSQKSDMCQTYNSGQLPFFFLKTQIGPSDWLAWDWVSRAGFKEGFVSYLYNWVVQVLLYRSRTVPLRQKETDPIESTPTQPGTPHLHNKNQFVPAAELLWGWDKPPGKQLSRVSKPPTRTPPQNQHHFGKQRTCSIPRARLPSKTHTAGKQAST